MQTIKLKMSFPFVNPPGLPKGDYRGEGVTASTTIEAILRHERTATTRFPIWYSRFPRGLEQIKGIKPGQQIIFQDDEGSCVEVEAIASDLSSAQSDLFNVNSHITSLAPNEIFVFGSNTEGRHGAGAARFARDRFGAVYGQATGLQGRSYGLITTNLGGAKLSRAFLADQVVKLYQSAIANPHLTYLVTPVGTGLAGHSVKEMADIFKSQGQVPDNIKLPGAFLWPHYEGLGGATYCVHLSDRSSEEEIQEWCRLEGWNRKAAIAFFAKEPSGYGYQFQFKLRSKLTTTKCKQPIQNLGEA